MNSTKNRPLGAKDVKRMTKAVELEYHPMFCFCGVKPTAHCESLRLDRLCPHAIKGSGKQLCSVFAEVLECVVDVPLRCGMCYSTVTGTTVTTDLKIKKQEGGDGEG